MQSEVGKDVNEKAETASGAAGGGSDDLEQALDDLERGLHQASAAVTLLRQALADVEDDRSDAPASASSEPEAARSPPTPPVEPPVPPAEKEGRGAMAFDRLWDRIERERMEGGGRVEEEPLAGAKSGLDLLPQFYLMTVEDREGSVDLVPLHRALSGVEGAQEISLVSYANGVPVISLRVDRELDFEQLSAVVTSAMDRECEVIPQDTGRLYLRMHARRG